jgi:hypothetical protein
MKSPLLTNRKLFYRIKPLMPRWLQLTLRGGLVYATKNRYRSVWPIDEKAAAPPACWKGWPEDKRFALVLTHDVDTARGQERCKDLAHLEQSLGFRSSFNFVPKRYYVSSELRDFLIENAFEVGVHGLYHDGKYYDSRETFKERAVEINAYLKAWNSVGFRSPSMHHNLEWLHDLDIEYDASTFDTDPFEPQSDGMATIFPFWVPENGGSVGYVELPYTLPQDFTLFVLMKEKGIDIWKRKLDWVAEHHGMALLNVHPDYIIFNGAKRSIEGYPDRFYSDFLEYVKKRYEGAYWHALPRDVARFWKHTAFPQGARGG